MWIIAKVKFKSEILKSIFLKIFFIYIKIPKTLSAKYYQENKERLQKKLLKDTKIFLKNKKKKSNNMVVNVTKISQKMKNKSFLSIEENIIEPEKTLYYNLENFASL